MANTEKQPEKKDVKLDTFGSIQIETYHGCNLNCKTCPNSVIEKHGELMEDDVFYELIDQLKQIGYRGRISPYLMNEPTLDQRLPKFIDHIKHELPDCRIMVGSNGIALTLEELMYLFEVGLDDILITCYNKATEDKFKPMEGGKVKLLVVHDKDLNKIFFNRAGNVKVGEEEVVSETCSKIKNAHVNYKGELIFCCSDYRYEVVAGNIMDERIDVLFNCDTFKHYRERLRARDRASLALCRRCNWHRTEQRQK